MRLAEIAARLELEVEGDGSVEIRGLAGLEDAGPGELSFATGPRYRRQLAASRGAAFLLTSELEAGGRPCLRSTNPYADFARSIELLFPDRARPAPGVHSSAVVAPDARLGDDVSVGACAVVGERVLIGDRTVIHPHVTLYPEVRIGADCVIHSAAQLREGTRLGDRVVVQNGVVIGSDGFGYVLHADGQRVAIPHRCPVEIADDVDIGANTAIDASHHGQARHGHSETHTRLGRGVKTDNLAHIGHGCDLGDGVVVGGQVGLAGSTVVGRHVLFGGQSASAGHLTIGDNTLVGARAAVGKSLEPGAQVLGTPAMERRAWGRFVAARKRIPELFRRLRRIEAKLGIGAEGEEEE